MYELQRAALKPGALVKLVTVTRASFLFVLETSEGNYMVKDACKQHNDEDCVMRIKPERTYLVHPLN